jgi:phosphoenolpyruvate-protein kinase (PTS system EI component)
VRRESADANILLGVGVSPGLAIGKIAHISAQNFDIQEKSSNPPPLEEANLQKAIREAVTELTAHTAASTGESQNRCRASRNFFSARRIA